MPAVQNALISVMVYSLIAIGSISAQGFSPRIDAAAARLAKAHIFAIGGVGFAGVTSEEEKDFRLILADHQAEKVFGGLYQRGNNQAKAYALLGLYLLGSDRYRDIYISLSTSNEELHLMQGCILSNEKLNVVAKRIDVGEFSRPASRK